MEKVDPIWAAEMTRVHNESAGMVQVHLVDARHYSEVACAALGGDVGAGDLLKAVAHARGQIAAAPRNRPMLCLCCPRNIRTCRGIVVVVATAEAARSAVSSAICRRCAHAHASDLQAAAIQGLRRIWPEARGPLAVHPQSGRA